jgi:hypothetical protein
MNRNFLVIVSGILIVIVSFGQINTGFYIASYEQQESEKNSFVTVIKKGHNTIAKAGNDIIYNGTDAAQGIQRAINFSPVDTNVHLYNGTYEISDRLNLTEGIFLHGQGNTTVLDYAGLAENKSAMTLHEGSHLSDMKLSGSISPLPRDFTQGIRTNDDTIIENVSIYRMGYGIDTTKSKNVTLSNIECEFIQSVRDWAACIHAASTEDLAVNNFRITDSNRGVELDAASKNVTVQNGEINGVKNFNNTGHEAFTLDAHSHDGEGGLDNISFRNVIIKDSYAPSVKIASENGKFDISDLPRKILFDNITVINPSSAWQVNGDNVILNDVRIINSSTNAVVLYKNGRGILIQNVVANSINADNCFICNRQEDSDIRNVTVINNTAFVDDNKFGPTMSFYGINGLSITKNRILNAPSSPDAIRIGSGSNLKLAENNISYHEKLSTSHTNGPISLKNLSNLVLMNRENPIRAISEIAEDTRKEYENETYGITLQYPSDWRRIDWRSLADFLSFYDINPVDSFTEVAQFYSRYQGPTDRYAEGIDIAVQNLTQDNSTLSELSNQALKFYKQYSDFQLVESSDENIFLSDIPAYRLIFTFVSDGFYLKWMEIGALEDNRMYRVTFFAESQRFDEFLPIAEQIINSIKIADGMQNDGTHRS